MAYTVQCYMMFSMSYQLSKIFRIATDWTVRGSNPSRNQFPAPVQTLDPPIILYVGYHDVIPGCGVNHPPPFNAEVKERVELYLFSPSVPRWKGMGPSVQKMHVDFSSWLFRNNSVIFKMIVIHNSFWLHQ